MIKRRKIILTILLICLFGQILFAQQGKYLSFFDGNTLHIRWNAKSGEPVNGYRVLRQAGGDNNWQLLTQDTLKMVLSRQLVKQRIGYRSSLYFSLFGVKDNRSDLTLQQVRSVFRNPRALGFLEVMSMVNPEFAELMGWMYHDQSVTPDNKYRYRIEALNNQTADPWVETDWISTGKTAVVPPVSGLSGLGADGRILLEWDKTPELLHSGEVASYRVYRADRIIGPYSPRNLFGMLPVHLKTDDENSQPQKEQYVDNYLTNDSTYYYYVKSVNAFGIESEKSLTLKLTVGADLLPDPPMNLRSSLPGGFIRIDWDQPANLTDGFQVFRSKDPDADYQLIWPPVSMIRSDRNYYLDQSVQEGITYYYFIRLSRDKKLSPASDTLAVTIPDHTPPKVPQYITAEAVNGGIRIRWSPNNEEDLLGYEIERTSDTAFARPFQLNAFIIRDTMFMDSISKLSPMTFGYRVFAYDLNYNRSAPSELVKARMPDIVAPQTPFVTSFNREGQKVILTWTESIDREFSEYRIYESPDSADWVQIGNTRDTHFSFSLKEPGHYRFAVSAVDQAENESPLSRVLKLNYRKNRYPAPPERFRARRNKDHHVQLSWELAAGTGITGYLITRTDMATGRMVDLAQVAADQTEYIDKRILKGKTYRYSIRTMNKNWAMSPVVSTEITIR